MADKKGILSKKDERWLAKFMDAAIKLPGLIELVDGAVIRVLIAVLDNIIIEKYVPDTWENPLEKLIALGKERDKEGIAKFLDEKINLPFIDGVGEAAAFEYAVKFIAGKMYDYIDSVDVEVEDVE